MTAGARPRLRHVPALVAVLVWGGLVASALSGHAGWLDRVPGGVVTVVAAGVAVGVWAARANRREVRDGFEQLVARDDWQVRDEPLGLTSAALASTATCPAGDRDHAPRMAAQCERRLTLGVRRLAVNVAVFQWWWESRSGGSDGTASYADRTRVVGAMSLPAARPFPRVVVRPEGVAARAGIGGRDDMQVESEAFNRAFRIEVDEADRPLVVRLFDPAFQQLLLERCRGRHFELVGRTVLLGGDPDEHDGVHAGPAGHYDRVVDDLLAVVDGIPDGFWRSLDAEADGTRPLLMRQA